MGLAGMVQRWGVALSNFIKLTTLEVLADLNTPVYYKFRGVLRNTREQRYIIIYYTQPLLVTVFINRMDLAKDGCLLCLETDLRESYKDYTLPPSHRILFLPD